MCACFHVSFPPSLSPSLSHAALASHQDLALDEVRQAQQGGASSAVATSVHSTTFKSPKSGTMSFMHARNIKRPQMAFPDAVDNSAASAFVPKLVGKPNALVPLDLKPIPLVSVRLADFGCTSGCVCGVSLTLLGPPTHPPPVRLSERTAVLASC